MSAVQSNGAKGSRFKSIFIGNPSVTHISTYSMIYHCATKVCHGCAQNKPKIRANPRTHGIVPGGRENPLALGLKVWKQEKGQHPPPSRRELRQDMSTLSGHYRELGILGIRRGDSSGDRWCSQLS